MDMMEEQSSKIDPRFIKYLKVATAIAIIKTKPENVTGQQHAEFLCNQFEKSQLFWKSQAEKLEHDVLVLQQEKLRHKWTSSCLLTQETAPSTQDDAPYDSQLFPTPPCSLEPYTAAASESESREEKEAKLVTTQSTQQAALEQHTTFLQSVLTLSFLNSQAELSSPHVGEVTLASAKAAFVSLGELLTRPQVDSFGTMQYQHISHKMMLHIAQVISNLADNEKFPGHIAAAIRDMTIKFTWGLVSALLGQETPLTVNQERLSRVVLDLSGSRTLRVPVTRMLVEMVVGCSARLSRALTEESAQPPGPLQLLKNSYHVFRTIELILEQEILAKDKLLTRDACRMLIMRLEESLLHVWQHYSPFAHYVWQLEGLLQYMHSDLEPLCPSQEENRTYPSMIIGREARTDSA